MWHKQLQKVKFLSKNSILTKPQYFHEFFTQIFLTNFLVKSKLSTAKKPKCTTFSRIFHPKKSTIFSGNQNWIFGQKMKISNSVLPYSIHFCFTCKKKWKCGSCFSDYFARRPKESDFYRPRILETIHRGRFLVHNFQKVKLVFIWQLLNSYTFVSHISIRNLRKTGTCRFFFLNWLYFDAIQKFDFIYFINHKKPSVICSVRYARPQFQS